jgi:hypothetical protein
MHPVICQFRDPDGNVTYFRADSDAQRATIDQVTSVERLQIYDGEYTETFGLFSRMAEDAGGLDAAEQAKVEAYHRTIARFQPAEGKDTDDDQEVDAGAPANTSRDNAKGIRGFVPWKIH